jgi:uncharacterized membrane protein
MFNALGVVLSFVLLNIEIANAFSTERLLSFDFTNNLKRDLAYTMGWSVFAFGMLVLGVWKTSRALRYASWSLLGVTIAKLFFHDLAKLGPLYRLGALITVAVMLVLASLVFQRFLNRSGHKAGGTGGDKPV